MELLSSNSGYIARAHEYMRAEPSPTAEVVSDAYYSEKVTVLKESGDWVQIQTQVDKYRGWIRKKAFFSPSEDFKDLGQIAKVNRLQAHVYTQEDTTLGPFRTLPFESELSVIGAGTNAKRWLKIQLLDGKEYYIQSGDVTLDTNKITVKEMVDLSHTFKDLPYTWGGRSSFGYDCSGFVQMLYRQCGIFLPRDSKDQYVWSGFRTISQDELREGDLIYFGRAPDKIIHVGVSLGDTRFIHSTVRENKPYIRISTLDDDEWSGRGELVFRGFKRVIES